MPSQRSIAIIDTCDKHLPRSRQAHYKAPGVIENPILGHANYDNLFVMQIGSQSHGFKIHKFPRPPFFSGWG
jgi:hypothetical protein